MSSNSKKKENFHHFPELGMSTLQILDLLNFNETKRFLHEEHFLK